MGGGDGKEEEQDVMSVHSPCKAPPSSSSSLSKIPDMSKTLYRFFKKNIIPLCNVSRIHRHFVLFGVMEFLRRSLDRHFSSEEVLRLLDRFYNLEMLKGDDEDAEFPHREEDFSLPQSYFAKEES
ncbi:hypothetical protein KSS87_013782 [Heliosperma pusillum]|nr:hypothetical protein KSS87_013782 [Heliosperma pusillum]